MKMNENVLKHFAEIKKLNIFAASFLYRCENKEKIFCLLTRRDETGEWKGAGHNWCCKFIANIIFEDIKNFFATFFSEK